MTYAVNINAWTDLHAEFAKEAMLEEARQAVREPYIGTARLDAAIATLQTGDAFDRWLAEQVLEQRAERIRHEREDVPEYDFSERNEGAGAIFWLSAALFILFAIIAGIPAYAMLLVWLGGIAT